MRKVISCLGACLLVIASVPAAATEADIAMPLSTAPVDVPAQLREASPAPAPQKASRKTYVVQLKGEPAISYEGDIKGLAATAPGKGKRYNAKASHVQQYTAYLERQQDKVLRRAAGHSKKIYSYKHALNGFAAQLTEQEAERLRKDKAVMQVWEDQAVTVDTNDSPAFLGLLDRREGLRTREKLLGEDIIVGIIDTGIVPQHPSLSDEKVLPFPPFCDNPTPRQKRTCDNIREKRTVKTYSAPPARWNGVCETGEGFAESDCNNKLIGARWYYDGFLAGTGGAVEGDFRSPRDSSGHGTHTATTAAGNEVVATLGGTEVATVSGMAPRARIAVYKACWLAPGAPNFSCFFSDTAAATEDAVADGVDVINYSIGTAAAFNDPQDIAFLLAADAGVFVARSAGNSGPGFATTNAGEPWVTSVGASTVDGTLFALAARINAPASLAGDYPAIEGVITGPLSELGPVTDDVVAADPIDACGPLANDIGGKIALIARGTCAFTVKVENAVLAGAGAILMYTDDRPKTGMGGDASELTRSVPGVMIDNDIGLELLAAINDGQTVNATLDDGIFVTEPRTGNIMAGFSSRGPYLTESDWIAPHITAPGVNILAGYSPDQADGSGGGLFGYLSGTSMSSPHIAGLAALVIEEHPDWSPAAVRSALMTTARQDVFKEDGATPADPFDFGAGHVDPNKAIDPGLIYDAGFLDYLAASCETVTPLSPGACGPLSGLGFSTDPADLNLPAIGIGELPGTKTVTRTVTNVGKNSIYEAYVDAPEGFDVTVSPGRLALKKGETATFEVTITNRTAPPNDWRFGSLTWKDRKGRYEIRSPIAVNARAFVAPPEVFGAGTEGSAEFDVTFGYTGPYTAGVHGLANPGLTLVPTPDDPGNSFVFLGPGVEIAFLEPLPPGTAHARWSTFNEYTSGNSDIDLYLYYCPSFSCTLIDSSTNVDSNESVEVTFPQTGPADFYLVFTHGYETDGPVADVILFDHVFGVVDDRGNMTVSAPSSASIGETATLEVDWFGLPFGPGSKQLGAISHSDASGVQDLTLINIENDAGFTLCDFGPLIGCE